MNIKDYRLQGIIDDVIKEHLSQGNLPTSDKVIEDITNIIASNDLSSPNFKFTRTRDDFSIIDYNAIKDKVNKDLGIIYKVIGLLYNDLTNKINKFEYLKSKTNYKIANYNREILDLILKYSPNGLIHGICETFSDMNRIDSGKTNAYVDIEGGEVGSQKIEGIPYTDFAISILTSNISQNADINTYMDVDGLLWQGIIDKDIQEETTLDLLVDIFQSKVINDITIRLQQIKPSTITVQVSEDNSNWTNIYTGKVLNKVSIINSNKLRYIKVSIKRDEADKYSDGKYRYYYLIDSISLSSCRFADISTFVSNKLNVDNKSTKCSLLVNEYKPYDTNISYYISRNGINWNEIKPGAVLSLNNVSDRHYDSIFISEDIAEGTLKLNEFSTQLRAIYKLSSIDDMQTIANHKLIKGIDSWKKETCNLEIDGEVTVREFNDYNIDSREYIKINEDKLSLLYNGEKTTPKDEDFTSRVIKYTIHFDNEGSQEIIKSVLKKSTNLPVCIYLNEDKLQADNDGIITYNIKQGKNTLIIIVNINNNQEIMLDLNLTKEDLSYIIYSSDTIMKEVPLFNLKNDANITNECYSLYDNKILVVGDITNVPYQFSYDRIESQVNELYLKAEFSTEDTNISPKLYYYELRLA